MPSFRNVQGWTFLNFEFFINEKLDTVWNHWHPVREAMFRHRRNSLPKAYKDVRFWQCDTVDALYISKRWGGGGILFLSILSSIFSFSHKNNDLLYKGTSKNFPFLEVFLRFICDVFFINYYSIKIYKKYSSGISKS